MKWNGNPVSDQSALDVVFASYASLSKDCCGAVCPDEVDILY